MGEPATRPLRVRRRTVAKAGREPEENEDSSAEDVALGRFAISDGASSCARSEVWSALLTDAFVRGDDPLAPDVLAGLRNTWRETVFDDNLPWFAQRKLMLGSAATFVGLCIDGDRYVATAVGDSCVFHLRDGELLLAAPLNDWTRFGQFPNLVTTGSALPAEHIWSADGDVVPGDVFLLATDALARHVLRTHALDGAVPPIRDHVDDDAAFAGFVERERERGMANDDSTVCVVLT